MDPIDEHLNTPPAAEPSRWSTYTTRATAIGRRIWPFPVGVLAALLAIYAYTLLSPTAAPLTPEQVNQIAVSAIASATPPPAYSAQVYQIILPSLVFIQTTGADPADPEGSGVGSGVVINAQADILTSLHVVEGATEIIINFADGTQTTGTIITADPANDIAVLQANQLPEVVVPAVMGSPAAMRVGDETYAVGNPLGLAGSMSAGVISGFDRTLPVNDTGQILQGLIQFDAAVNPGNSGGPLLNRNGQVIGIVTALVNPDNRNSFSGIGFAVPITTASGAAGGPEY